MKKLITCLVIFLSACSAFPGHEKIDPANFSLQLSRGACFGKCPVYTVTVQPDGRVQFTGVNYTRVAGGAEGTLSREKLDQLAAEINRADVFAFEDSYLPHTGNCPSTATDSATVKLIVTSDYKRKAIEHYHGCFDKSKTYPPELVELENTIDRIIGTDQWIK